jgi:hypothetical protein
VGKREICIVILQQSFGISSGGPAFSPTDISGLKLWLKADTLVLNDNDPVGTWADQSGNANNVTQATAANKPLYKTAIINGKPVVRFDGINDSLANATPSLTIASSVFVVGALGVAAGSQTAYAPFAITGAGTGSRLCCRLTGTNWGTYVGSDLSSGEDLVNGAFNILVITTSSTPVTFLYRNGTQKATTGSQSVGSGNNTEIGSEVANSRWINGDITEVVMYDTILSGTNRDSVTNYLNGRYAIF